MFKKTSNEEFSCKRLLDRYLLCPYMLSQYSAVHTVNYIRNI